MATSPIPCSDLRKEVKEYIRSCERLLYSAMPSANAPLSADEREMVEYYQEELKAQLLRQKTH
ncbi:MAG: hypothetical protein NDI90_15550 [Nitrospira sp. BO4]|jgi:hypothetical protein|nr:hypothetical protein [Nitrospira sp. BO4]